MRLATSWRLSDRSHAAGRCQARDNELVRISEMRGRSSIRRHMKTTPCFVMNLQLVMGRVYPYVVLTEGSKKKGDGSNGSLQKRWTHNCQLLGAMVSDMNSSTVQGI